MKFIQHIQNGLIDTVQWKNSLRCACNVQYTTMLILEHILFILFWWELYPQKPYTQDPWRGSRQKKVIYTSNNNKNIILRYTLCFVRLLSNQPIKIQKHDMLFGTQNGCCKHTQLLHMNKYVPLRYADVLCSPKWITSNTQSYICYT
jgi:hypothetical protein